AYTRKSPIMVNTSARAAKPNRPSATIAHAQQPCRSRVPSAVRHFPFFETGIDSEAAPSHEVGTATRAKRPCDRTSTATELALPAGIRPMPGPVLVGLTRAARQAGGFCRGDDVALPSPRRIKSSKDDV